MSTETISILIRVRNQAAALRKVLRALELQSVKPAEIVIVDNASTDGSGDIARQFGAKILELAKEDFTYGRALNVGISHTTGRYVCILSAHSLPVGPNFLQNAVAPFSDARVAAVRCPSINNRGELENWMTPTTLEWPVEIEAVISSAPVNSAAMIRRSVWEQIPYDETVGGVEDKFWAFEVLKRGYRIVNSGAFYVYLRDLGFGEQVRKLYRDRVEFFRKTGREWQEPPVSLRRVLNTILYAIPRRAVRCVAYEIVLYAYLKTVPLKAARIRRHKIVPQPNRTYISSHIGS